MTNSHRRLTAITALAVLAISGTVLAADLGAARQPVTAAAQDLMATYPGVRVHTGLIGEEPLAVVYGKPMTVGVTPQAAAADWLAAHASSLGVEDPTLVETRSHDVSHGRFTVFAYQQTIDGMPVEHGIARVLVLNGAMNQVVYASGKLVAPPAGGFAAQTVTADDALASVQGRIGFQGLDSWQQPELAVFVDPASGRPVRVWKFMGWASDPAVGLGYTFFIDASTGDLLEARNEVYNFFVDVDGNVTGMGSPGTLPDIPANPPVALPMGFARVSVLGGNFSFSDMLGDFSIIHGGAGSVTVNTSLQQGQWSSVFPAQGTAITASQNVTPPGPADFLLNAAPSQFTTSQVNAFYHATLTHEYFSDRAPGFTAIDMSITTNVNQASTCNANFQPANLSINFFNAGGGCRNTAYSTVISHEYGHFVVNRLGLAQGAFGEGFSDTCGIMIHDTHIMGEEFRDDGSYVRDPEAANIQYPCSGAIHFCGQLIGGIVWDMRVNFGNAFGPPGLEMMRQLHVDWTMITVGGISSNSAHPATAIEFLTVDDNDGDIGNGTPNYGIICQAFGDHSIQCPELNLLGFEFPDGLPEVLEPDSPTEIRVHVVPVSGSPVPGSGAVTYRTDVVGPITIPMTETAPNEYTATLPGFNCPTAVHYYFSAQDAGGMTVVNPSGAPEESYVATSAYGSTDDFNDFEAGDGGWTVGAPGDNATTGVWVRVDPIGTAAQPENDHTPEPGVMAWVTGQGSPGGALGENDVDNGSTTLLTPTLDLTAGSGAVISYWRWYSNVTGAAPGADVFVIDITNNGGLTWTNVETVGPTGPETEGGWYFHQFRVADFVNPTTNVKVRFIASDLGSGSIVEAAIDDFNVRFYDCNPPKDPCPADLDGSGGIDTTDLNILLSAFGCAGGGCAGDIDGDGDTDTTDLNLLLSLFGTDCP